MTTQSSLWYKHPETNLNGFSQGMSFISGSGSSKEIIADMNKMDH